MGHLPIMASVRKFGAEALEGITSDQTPATLRPAMSSAEFSLIVSCSQIGIGRWDKKTQRTLGKIYDTRKD
jgi:hypothetical protein